MKRRALVIAGASGCGKTTVAERISRNFPDFEMSRSYTTRAPRADGREYEYVYLTRENFLEKCRLGDMLEYTEYGATLYGTAKEELERIFSARKFPLLVLDLNGVRSLKSLSLDIDVFTVYLFNSLDVIEERLMRRMGGRELTDDELLTVKRRNAINIKDYLSMHEYTDYIDAFVLNDSLDECIDSVISCFNGINIQSGEEKSAAASHLVKMAKEKTEK